MFNNGKKLVCFILIGVLLISTNAMATSITQKTSAIVENIQDEKLSMLTVRELYKQGKYSLAEQVLDKLTSTGENSAEFHIYCGYICNHQNRPNAAIEEYGTAFELLELSPADSLYRMTYRGLADAYYAQNDFKMSAAYFRKYREQGGDISLDHIAYLAANRWLSGFRHHRPSNAARSSAACSGVTLPCSTIRTTCIRSSSVTVARLW